MTLDNETHRQFLINAVQAAPVQGRLEELRAFVAQADELIAAVTAAVVDPPASNERLGDDLHA